MMNIRGLITLCFLFILETITGQYVYFYEDGGTRNLNKNEVTIYSEDKKLGEMEYNWIRLDLKANKKYDLKLKSAFYKKTKKIRIDFTKKNVVFVAIKAFDESWQLVEETIEDAEFSVTNDYEKVEKEIQLQQRIKTHPNTGWTKEKLQQRFDKETKGIEGIYEVYLYQSSPRYIVGIIKEDKEYSVIYLAGTLDPKIWTEGDLKAELIRTASPTLFKVHWYGFDKSINKRCYIEFFDYSFRLTQHNDVITYMKMYPTFKE